MPVLRAASARLAPSRTSAIASNRRACSGATAALANARSSPAPCSARTATVIRASIPSAASRSIPQRNREITNEPATWTLGMSGPIDLKQARRAKPGELIGECSAAVVDRARLRRREHCRTRPHRCGLVPPAITGASFELARCPIERRRLDGRAAPGRCGSVDSSHRASSASCSPAASRSRSVPGHGR